jgi:hypothetical protein
MICLPAACAIGLASMLGYMPVKQYLDRINPVWDCHIPQYTVRTLSYDPLLLHIEGFIGGGEREYLKRLAYVIPHSLQNGSFQIRC